MERIVFYETGKVNQIYKCIFRIYVLCGNCCTGGTAIYTEVGRQVLLCGNRSTVLADVDYRCSCRRMLRKMMKTVINRDCFVDNNVKSLSLMGKVSFVISVLFVIKLFFLPTPATFVVILTFFIAGLFSHVLACVFKEAVRLKNENDLTI